LKSNLPSIYFDSERLSKFEYASSIEWILTNGLGGYASSTILNVNTRKFHGLLFTAFNPPTKRYLLLSKIDEEIHVGGERYPLSSNQFRDVIHPDGYRNLEGFIMDPLPSFLYKAGDVYLKKEIFMPYLRDVVVVRYEVFNGSETDAALHIYPLINMRHFYETTRKGDFETSREVSSNSVLFKFSPKRGFLLLSATSGVYVDHGDLWIEKIYFRRDDLRGESCLDDCLQPGFFKINLKPRYRMLFYLLAAGGTDEGSVKQVSSEIREKRSLDKLYAEEKKRREKLLKRFYGKRIKCREDLSWLVLSADSFITLRKRTGRRTIIAGYHWFEDWGRDALISLPGLTLVTGRFSEAEEILETFSENSRNGLLPSRFPETTDGTPEYESVDSSLWFFNAVLQYVKYTRNLNFVYRHLWETMQEIIKYYIHGTAHGIHADIDGLIVHDSRLTWMDAVVDGVPVTPRKGKAVEVQALWYNALKTMEILSRKLGFRGESEKYSLLASRVKKSFNKKFYYVEGGYLYDVIDGNIKDASLRPNQIISVSLDFPILDPPWDEKIVEAVLRNLLTPYGLRSLAPDDPRYVGTYSGGFPSRDRAYHNGTVWTWLLGQFIMAFLKVKNYESYWRRFAFERFMKPLLNVEIYRAGLGTLSEIFDGDSPHHPRGCISQAWSVAESLRAYVEDILLIRPPYKDEFVVKRSRREKA